MAKDDRHEFRFDCGATWLNLLATRGRSFSTDPVERLATPGRLAEWLEHCELSPARPPAKDDLRRTWELRETLRSLALATVEGRPPPATAMADLVAFLGRHDDPIRLLARDRLRREPPRTTAGALARIAHQAVDQLTGSDRLTLKVCPEQDCRGVFLDPPGRRRWCPSEACASRGRVRALRARRNAAGSTVDSDRAAGARN